MHPAMTQLANLPLSERLELVQELWNSIDTSREQMPVEQWQRELVLARLAELEGQEETQGLSRDQVWQQVDERRGA